MPKFPPILLTNQGLSSEILSAWLSGDTLQVRPRSSPVRGLRLLVLLGAVPVPVRMFEPDQPQELSADRGPCFDISSASQFEQTFGSGPPERPGLRGEPFEIFGRDLG